MNDIIQILLVEDDPDDLELVLHALKRNNLANRVHVARDGEEALNIIFGTPESPVQPICPRVVLLDLKLPKVDGLEVLRRIKTDPRTMSTPVVIMTSSQEERDIVESYRLGTNSYVVKPLDFKQFTDAVRRLGLYWLLTNQTPR